MTIPRPSASARHYWRNFAAGFATSLLAHEGAHVVTAIAVGVIRLSASTRVARPSTRGSTPGRTPHKQFLFSSMGLNVQAALDEAILDVPHRRGAPFERGVLLGGIATALFYVTIGRTASVSDVDFMARTSSLSKTDITLIYGGVAAAARAAHSRDGRYADFFVRPAPAGDHGLGSASGCSSATRRQRASRRLPSSRPVTRFTSSRFVSTRSAMRSDRRPASAPVSSTAPPSRTSSSM